MTENTPPSVPQSRRGITVAASPFNGVKLELGVIVILLVGVVIATESWVTQSLNQFLILATVGGICAGWLLVRIRQVMKKQAADSGKFD